MKNHPIILMLLPIMLILTSCQNNAIHEISEGNTMPQTKLRVLLTKQQYKIEKYNVIEERIKLFEKKFPMVKVEVQKEGEITSMKPIDYNRLLEDHTNIPDLIEINPNMARYALKGKLEDLFTYIDMVPGMWTGGFSTLLHTAEVDSERVMIPVRSISFMVYYNKELFGQLGIPDPSEGWTWEEFVAAGRKLKAAGHYTEIPRSLNWIEPITRGLGGTFNSPDQMEYKGYLDSEATAAAYEQIRQTDLNVEHVKNRAYDLGFMVVSEIRRETRRNMNIAPMPTFNGQQTNTASISGLAIPTDSKNKDAAWKLLSFIVGQSDEEALEFVASNTMIFEEPDFYTDPETNDTIIKELMINDMKTVDFPSTFYISNFWFRTSSAPITTSDDIRNSMIDTLDEGKNIKTTLNRLARLLEKYIPVLYPSP